MYMYVLVDALKSASFPLLLMRGTRWEYGQGVHLLLQILAKLFNRSSFADAKPNLASSVCGPGKDMGNVGKDKGRDGYRQGKQGYGQGRWEGMGFKIARMGRGLVMVASSGGTLGQEWAAQIGIFLLLVPSA